VPTALVLTLRPLEPATVAPHLGRSSHAALLDTIAQRDAALAMRLHDSPDLKPFAASDLLDAPVQRDARALTAERSYRLRWSGVSDEMDAVLRHLANEPPAELTLDHARFAVERATVDTNVDVLAGSAQWNELLALETIGRGAPPKRMVLHFLSPATFRSNGRNIPLPLPELVFGSLLDRWNAVSPIALPGEVRRFAAECLVLSSYELRSVWVPAFGVGETAFIGRCSYVATTRDRYYLHCCAALMRLAFYSGVGAKTSMGFGMLRGREAGS